MKWISVNWALPLNRDSVLGCGKREFSHDDNVFKCYFDNGKWFVPEGGDEESILVEYWMPLPKPCITW